MILYFDEILLHIQDHDDPGHLIKAHFSCLLFAGRAGRAVIKKDQDKPISLAE